MKEVKFHTLYSEPNGTREEIPALKGKDAEVPKATDSTYGTIKGGYGVRINANGEPYVDRANDTQIDTKAGSYYPIVPYNLDRAVRAGLVSNSQIVDADKSAICQTIGAYGQWVKIHESTLEESTIQVQIPVEPKKRRFLRIFIYGDNPVTAQTGAGTSYAQVFGAEAGSGSGVAYFMTQADRKNIWVDVDFSDKIRSYSYATYSNYGTAPTIVSMMSTLKTNVVKEVKLTTTNACYFTEGMHIEVYEML